MTSKKSILAAGVFALAGVFLAPISASAQGLTMQECSVKYKSAQAAGSLGGQTWNDFRKAQCSADAPKAAAPAAAPAPAAAAPKAAPAAAPKAQAAAPIPASNATFPRALDKKYATETPSKQRMKTCLDQYNVNKTNGGNADLKWIQKGGGYYSQCNARMKAIQGV